MPVTLTSDRAGLVMETGAKVKMRGVQVGRVAPIGGGSEPVSLKLEIDPGSDPVHPGQCRGADQGHHGVRREVRRPDLPRGPQPQAAGRGAVLMSQNVSTEVNTVFQNLVDVLHQIDPAKLNAVLTALAEGVRGQGERIGQAITAANQVLMALNPRSDTMRADWRSLKGFSDAYGAAAHDILTPLDAASTTSADDHQRTRLQLDALLLNVIGFADSGIRLLGPSQDNLISADQRARAHDRPADEVQPRIHLPAVRAPNGI